MGFEDRHLRFAAVAAGRLSWVRCAAEHVHHRHNVSALLRTSEALGVHHVHLVGDAGFTPAKGPVRGAHHWLELHRHREVGEAIAEIKGAGYALWVADLADPPTPPSVVPVDRPICLWFGAELVGVSPEAREAADGVVTIPMRGFAQSLNISVAAAITMSSVAERARAVHGEAALLPREQREALLASWLEREEEELGGLAARQRALELFGAALSDGEVYPPAPGSESR